MVIGVARDATSMRGYVRPEAGGPIALSVVLPPGVSSVAAWSGSTALPVTVGNGVARLVLQGSPGAASDWALTW